ncbi:hypothetical protein AB0L40_01660 [Patulibacter sp. NPDC049589]|uniref:hypothetical protein n=1 Tax=Patulibacter sp. NPDC049589 TaxID=3154731 RepID=UPI003415D45A
MFDRRIRPVRPAQWYAGLTIVFLGARAVSTLAAGASFGTPGDGWRSVLQLAICAVLAFGLARREHEVPAVLLVGAAYLLMTGLELVHDADLLGVVPVDARDRVVHPLLGVLALALAWATTRRARTPAPA